MSFEELLQLFLLTEKVKWVEISDLPTTDDWDNAGMIDKDGNLIDFTANSGRKIYHEELASTWEETGEIWQAGYIRINMVVGVLQIGTVPTDKQWEKLAEFVNNSTCISVVLNGSTGTMQKDFNSGAPRKLIMNVIRAYYAGEDIDIQDRFLQ